MAPFKYRLAKNTLFKGTVISLLSMTLAVFALLFAFIIYKGTESLFEPTVTLTVDFNTNTPESIYQDHRHTLTPGALKHLYRAFHDTPAFQGNLSLPSSKKSDPTQLTTWFFNSGDSRYPDAAGILGALMGSLYVLMLTLITALPIGLSAGIYLEELAPRHKFFSGLEIIISNLAAVPSIIYGLLGLTVFIHFIDLPRSSALVGGLTLALMSLPTLVTSTRFALRTVPRSLRDSAQALGASALQVTFHHVIPFALPNIMTGILISMARVFGETAPLLIVGLMAFNPQVPQGFSDPATTLPVQIFMWSRNPEPEFIGKAAAAILVLGLFLVMITLIALKFRRSHEQKTQ